VRAPRPEEIFSLSKRHPAPEQPNPTGLGEVHEYTHQIHDSDSDILPTRLRSDISLVGQRGSEVEIISRL
jgi:hypothetical protein